MAKHPDKYIVEFSGPYSFRVPTSIGEDNDIPGYEVTLKDFHAELRLGDLDNERGAFSGSGAVTFPRDRHGLLSSQKVQVHFDSDYISRLPDDVEGDNPEVILGSEIPSPDQQIIEDSVSVYNRFIELYKVQTESFWMRSLNAHEIHGFTIKCIEDNEVVNDRSHGLSGGAVQMGTIPQEDDLKLRQSLAENLEVTLSRKLELDIYDKIDLGEYRLAIISTNQLFVFWTRREYTKILKKMGKSEQEAKNRMWNDGRGEFHHIKTIYEMIDSDIGSNLLHNEEFAYWNYHCREKRNRIVHQGVEANKKDADKALQYTSTAMTEFKRRFNKELN
jgi:hypothetical protein